MTLDMIVSLDPIVEGEILVKNVSGDFLDRVVKDVVIYMTDPSADGSNPGYNETEKGVASLIRKWMKKAEDNPGHPHIRLDAVNKQGGPVRLDLTRVLGTYLDEIILDAPPVNGGVPTITKNYIGMYIRPHPSA